MFPCVLVALASVVCACGCGDSTSTESASQDGHTRMLHALQKIRERTQDEHPYLGSAQLKQAESVLATLQDDAIHSRFQTQWVLAYHLARAGRLDESIAMFEAAYESWPNVREQLSSEQSEQFLLHMAAACLRLGETENCIHCQTGESCILPLKGGGLHIHQEGTLKSIRIFNQLLKENPQHLAARWLLNIATMAVDQYPDGVPERFRIAHDKFESSVPFPRFADVARQLGMNEFNLCGGTCIEDFDNDGFLDVFTSTWDTSGEPVLFRNRGDGTFQRRVDEAGLSGLFGGLNLIHADYDNDGAIDVLVLRGGWLGDAGKHPNSLLKNDGTGHFRDVTFETGLGEKSFPTQTAAWADFNNDGHLDLYVGNEGGPAQLFVNNGQGRFRDIARTAGVRNHRFTKAVVWGDYNDDGFADLYVSNYQQENRLYRNNKDETFTDVSAVLGVSGPVNSFPAWFWDYNNDGILDLYVSSWWPDVKYVAADFFDEPHEAETACLYEGDGKGGFRNVSASTRLTGVSQPMGANFGDLDNDGWLDICLGTGYPEYEALMPNRVYRNAGGNTFEDVTMAGGFGHLQKGHGVAFGDLNNNGSQDLYIQMGGAYPGDEFGNLLLQNPGFRHHWIGIKLVGQTSNRSAIGCRIRVIVIDHGQPRSIFKWVNSGGSFGANPLQQQIGLGNATEIDRVEVFWPVTGITQVVDRIDMDQFVEITEGVEGFRRRKLKSFPFAVAATAEAGE